jgi:coenzyme F420-reducing hydrogenase delta subunit
MTTAQEARAVPGGPAVIPQGPRVLVFSTNAISDPGIDLAGSLHMHYSPEVVVYSLPCTSAIRPDWILFALQEGFDGVFIASDGDECPYLADCGKRSAEIMYRAQDLLAEHGIADQRLKMAAICSVCAESFTRQIREFTETLTALKAA